jgi:hypothetical protein
MRAHKSTPRGRLKVTCNGSHDASSVCFYRQGVLTFAKYDGAAEVRYRRRRFQTQQKKKPQNFLYCGLLAVDVKGFLANDLLLVGGQPM